MLVSAIKVKLVSLIKANRRVQHLDHLPKYLQQEPESELSGLAPESR